MRFVSSIFVLLTIAVKLFSAANFDCTGNMYQHDPQLVSKLQGYLYTVYTSAKLAKFSNNEIFKFDPIVSNNIFTRTTSDGKCCKTMNVSTELKGVRRNTGEKGGIGEYLEYVIANDKDCPTQLTETAHLKLIASNAEADGSYCIILWTCRTSGQGVHAFCTTTKITNQQRDWIMALHTRLRLFGKTVVHNMDYKNGKCFRKRHPF